jgi:hypothetical protein
MVIVGEWGKVKKRYIDLACKKKRVEKRRELDSVGVKPKSKK